MSEEHTALASTLPSNNHAAGDTLEGAIVAALLAAGTILPNLRNVPAGGELFGPGPHEASIGEWSTTRGPPLVVREEAIYVRLVVRTT